MKRDEIAMGIIAREAMGRVEREDVTGTLSLEERELLAKAPIASAWIENEEGWLYFHLSTARDRRRDMLRAGRGSDHYFELDNDRQRALFMAQGHYDNLRREEGWQLTADLAGMMKAEGL